MRVGQIKPLSCHDSYSGSGVGGASALLCYGAASTFEFAYLVDGTKWLRGEAAFYVSVPGNSATDVSWNRAVIDALYYLTNEIVFNFTVVEEYKDPCAVDGFSTINFTTDFCGSEFGENTLAVAVRRFEREDKFDNIIEGDIVVNAGENKDIYNGLPFVSLASPIEVMTSSGLCYMNWVT